MKRKGYMFTNKKHPLPGIMSAILGGIGLISLLFGMIRSYHLSGDIPARFGMAGTLAFLYALVGIVMALFMLKRQNAYHLFPLLGVGLCGATLLLGTFLWWLAS